MPVGVIHQMQNVITGYVMYKSKKWFLHCVQGILINKTSINNIDGIEEQVCACLIFNINTTFVLWEVTSQPAIYLPTRLLSTSYKLQSYR